MENSERIEKTADRNCKLVDLLKAYENLEVLEDSVVSHVDLSFSLEHNLDVLRDADDEECGKVGQLEEVGEATDAERELEHDFDQIEDAVDEHDCVHNDLNLGHRGFLSISLVRVKEEIFLVQSCTAHQSVTGKLDVALKSVVSLAPS